MNEEKEKESEIGILKNIRFQNNTTGFIIGGFENQKKGGKDRQFTALGNMANAEIGLAYKLFGKWGTDSKFGKQFKFEFYEVMQPSSTKGIYQYIVRICKFVGPRVAGKIVDRYKEETLNVLKNKPELVAKEIKGINEPRALEIQATLKKSEHIEKVTVELEKIFASIAGARKSLPVELVKYWGSDAVIKLKENPYMLTRIRGVGFPTADQIALQMGFNRKAKSRCKSAIHHVLNENMHKQGSVWIEHGRLVEDVKDLIEIFLDDALEELVNIGEFSQVGTQYSFAEMAENEEYIADKIIRMVTHGNIKKGNGEAWNTNNGEFGIDCEIKGVDFRALRERRNKRHRLDL